MLGNLYPPNTDSAVTATTAALPGSVILDMPPAGDQGSQSSCAAWAAIYEAGSYGYHLQTGLAYNDSTVLSPAYSYNQITRGDCTCTSLIDNLNILKYQGASPLSNMAYSDTECSLVPDSVQIKKAANFKISKWAIVKADDLSTIKRLLFEKHVLIIVIAVDEDFEHLSSPFIWNETQHSSGQLHAVTVTGYDDSKNIFRIMNSWGNLWADNGFAWIDYNYFKINVMDCFAVY